MDAIAHFFLRAKHWQIFLLIFGAGFIGEIAAMVFMPPLASPLPLAAVSALFMCGYLAWLWAMGSFLASIVRPRDRINMALFRLTQVFPILYAFTFTLYFKHFDSAPWLAQIFLDLLVMFCFFHNIYFVSNDLVVAETGKPTTSFLDYAGPFFLLWFYPIGVWFIQPRINALYARRNQTETFAPAPAN